MALSAVAATAYKGYTLVSGHADTVTNLFGFTGNICAQVPTDAQLAVILQAADPNEPEMLATRKQFGLAETEGREYGDKIGVPRDMAIYHAPISVVGNWARYDCKSAGKNRQALVQRLAALNAKYGAGGATYVQDPQRSVLQRVDGALNTAGRVLDAASGNAVPSASTQAATQQVLNHLPLIVMGIAAVFVLRAVVK